MNNVKTTGAVFTPKFITNLILDSINYNDTHILNKYIMEPSFGDGAFLIEIVSRYIKCAKKVSMNNIEESLDEYIHGIELNNEYFEKTKQRLNELLQNENLKEIEWSHLFNADTIEIYDNYINFFDYVVGNPPYIRIQNLSQIIRNNIENLNFTNGNTDLYICFYEIGIKMLNENGVLSFITPNSFLKNSSQKDFRKYLLDNSLLNTIYDFKSSKIFQNADTYTCICTLTKEKNEEVKYREYNNSEIMFERIFDYSYLRRQGFIFLNKIDEKFLEENSEKIVKISDKYNVQNGVATNLDRVYIGEAYLSENEIKKYFGKHTDEKQLVWFNNSEIESTILHRCVKESKFNGNNYQYILYPYENGKLISEEKLKNEFPKAYKYLCEHRKELDERNVEKNSEWYAFGRSQGIKNMDNQKIIFSHILKNEIRTYSLDDDVVVYSGIYSTGKDLEKLEKIYNTDEFLKYCNIMGKNMNGGYVAISSKIVKNFGIE